MRFILYFLLVLFIFQNKSTGAINNLIFWNDFEGSINEHIDVQNAVNIDIYQISETDIQNEALFFIRVYEGNSNEIIFENEIVLPLEFAIKLQDGDSESIQYLLEWEELIINEARFSNLMSSEGQEKMQFTFLNREDKIKRECDAGRIEVCSSIE